MIPWMNETFFFALSLDVFSVLSTLYPITRAADDPGNELIFYSWEEKCTLQSSAQIKSPQCRSSRSIIVPHLSFISFRYSQIKLRFVECSWASTAGCDECLRALRAAGLVTEAERRALKSIDNSEGINQGRSVCGHTVAAQILSFAVCSTLPTKGRIDFKARHSS